MVNQNVDITVVSPVYKADQIVDKLVSEIIRHVSPISDNIEIILVEDGGQDNSWEKIVANCQLDKRVKGIKLSRNFGQHYAITAGLEKAKGDWIIVMDCDLQDRPDQIPKLYAAALEGNDIVFARRVIRLDGVLKKLSSYIFYKIFGFLTDTRQDNSIANFGVYHKKVIAAVLSMKDHVRYFPTMSQWVGFKKTYVEVNHGERDEGESSYSWRKLFKLALDNIISFSDKPLRLTVQFGLLISITSGLIGLFYLVQYWIGKIVVSGFTSIIISIWFLSGIIIFILGMIGLYLGKIFEKVKERPVYIIDETINL